jgi:hypothetical protein
LTNFLNTIFAALEDLGAEVEINRAWEMIRENTKISAKETLRYCELKKQIQLANKMGFRQRQQIFDT